jgi:hypothetical protein
MRVVTLGIILHGRANAHFSGFSFCAGPDCTSRTGQVGGFLTSVKMSHLALRLGITIYLTYKTTDWLGHAQQMTGYEPPRTTRLYDRTKGRKLH